MSLNALPKLGRDNLAFLSDDGSLRGTSGAGAVGALEYELVMAVKQPQRRRRGMQRRRGGSAERKRQDHTSSGE